VKFPNRNIVRNVLRLPNSSVNYWGGQSIWTHPYWPQPAHSHWQHSPTRATTQEMLFRSTTQGIARALTPIPSHNSRDTFRATTQILPAIPPLKYHQKPCRSRLQNQQPKVAVAKLPGGGHIPPSAATSRLLGGEHVPSSAKRLWCYCFCKYRLAGQPLPPSTTPSILYWFCSYRLTVKYHGQALH